MSSKLHHRGTLEQAVAWEPPSKDGTRAVRPARENSSPSQQRSENDSRTGDSEREINERIQAGYQRGAADGEAAGLQKATTQFNSALEKIARTVEEVSAAKSRLRHEAEEDVVKLAMAIARRILYRELTMDPGALLGLVRAALDKLDGREVHRLRANPQDAPVLQQCLQQIGGSRKIEVFADAGLPRGSAIFETSQGSLDASVDTQLNEIERGFTDLMKRTPG